MAAGCGLRRTTVNAMLGIDHTDIAFHDRLQPLLYRHALTMLRRGVNVILEDGLWTGAERAEKFAGARDCGALIDLHVFDVPFETLWERLQRRQPTGSCRGVPDDEGRAAVGLGSV